MTATAYALAPAPVLAAQAAFRAIMNAMARPGTVHTVDPLESVPAPLSPTAAAVALTIFDHDTSVWLDAPLAEKPEVANWLHFHTSTKIIAEIADAQFALLADPEHAPPFGNFNLGTSEYPDRSTTVIFQVQSLKTGTPIILNGPGIRGSRRFCASPLPADVVSRLAVNRGLFPRGVDLLLVGKGAVAALPRSVRITSKRN